VKTLNNTTYSVWVSGFGNEPEAIKGLHETQHQKPSSVKWRGFFISIPYGLSAASPWGGVRAVLRCRKTKKHSVRSEETHNPRSLNSLLICTLSDNDDGFPVGHGSGLAKKRRLIKGGIVSWVACLKASQVLPCSFLSIVG